MHVLARALLHIHTYLCYYHAMRKVKIVATLGKNDSPALIHRLAEAGVDVFRNNMAHATREELVKRLRAIRGAEKQLGRPLAALGDLMGPKIRIGNVVADTQIQAGAKLRITAKPVLGDTETISLNNPSILKHIQVGAEVYLGDGALKLEVIRKQADGVLATVIVGGELRPRMGFACHGLKVAKSGLSAKDKRDIATLVSVGIDSIGVSFVQSARDILAVRRLLPKAKRPRIIAKIETLAAVKNAEEILDAADGLMIARGDLGFGVPMAEIPFIQKDLIDLALRKSKPVITATQMLESMVVSHLPTRAEVADVTKAVLDGTDAVMLSGETALGKFPEEAVKMMAKIIDTATPRVTSREFPDHSSVADAVSASVVNIADQMKARLIIVLTSSGSTARRIARHRPKQPILALSSNHYTSRNLAFTWGVRGVQAPLTKDMDQLIATARKAALKNSVLCLKRGEPFVISAGIPFGKSGSTNLVLIQYA